MRALPTTRNAESRGIGLWDRVAESRFNPFVRTVPLYLGPRGVFELIKPEGEPLCDVVHRWAQEVPGTRALTGAGFGGVRFQKSLSPFETVVADCWVCESPDVTELGYRASLRETCFLALVAACAVWSFLTYWNGYSPLLLVINLGVAIGVFVIADRLVRHLGATTQRATIIQACLRPLQERVTALIEEQVTEPGQVIANLPDIPSRPGVASGLDSLSNLLLHPFTPKVSQTTRATTLKFAGNYGAAPVAAAHLACCLWRGMHAFCTIGKCGTVRQEEHAMLRVVAPLTGRGEAIIDLRLVGVQGQITCIAQGYALLWPFVDWKNCIKPIGGVFLASVVVLLFSLGFAGHMKNNNFAYAGLGLGLFALLGAVMRWARDKRDPTAHEQAELDALVATVTENVNAVATARVEMEWSAPQRPRVRSSRRLFSSQNLGRPAMVASVLLAAVAAALLRLPRTPNQEPEPDARVKRGATDNASANPTTGRTNSNRGLSTSKALSPEEAKRISAALPALINEQLAKEPGVRQGDQPLTAAEKTQAAFIRVASSDANLTQPQWADVAAMLGEFPDAVQRLEQLAELTGRHASELLGRRDGMFAKESQLSATEKAQWVEIRDFAVPARPRWAGDGRFLKTDCAAMVKRLGPLQNIARSGQLCVADVAALLEVGTWLKQAELALIAQNNRIDVLSQRFDELSSRTNESATARHPVYGYPDPVFGQLKLTAAFASLRSQPEWTLADVVKQADMPRLPPPPATFRKEAQPAVEGEKDQGDSNSDEVELYKRVDPEVLRRINEGVRDRK